MAARRVGAAGLASALPLPPITTSRRLHLSRRRRRTALQLLTTTTTTATTATDKIRWRGLTETFVKNVDAAGRGKSIAGVGVGASTAAAMVARSSSEATAPVHTEFVSPPRLLVSSPSCPTPPFPSSPTTRRRRASRRPNKKALFIPARSTFPIMFPNRPPCFAFPSTRAPPFPTTCRSTASFCPDYPFTRIRKKTPPPVYSCPGSTAQPVTCLSHKAAL